MTDAEKGDKPVADDAQTTETAATQTLPDAPAENEVEKLKADHAEAVKLADSLKAEKEKLEQRLKDNQEYISRTRKVDNPAEAVAKPQKTMEDYLGDLDKIVDNDFENDPKQGLKKALRKIVGDVAWDRDAERQEFERRVAEAEDRAFKKTLALNPESVKTLKEIETLDEECPDLKGLSYERKVEIINLRKAGASRQATDSKEKINREASLAGGVGGSNLRRGGERIPAWVDDPEAVAALGGKFKTKQEALTYADPEKAKRAYEQKMAQQRQG